MISTPGRAVRPLALLGLVLVALVGFLMPAAPARAHAVLISSSPAPDVVLDSAPSEVTLTFSESVRQVPDRIRVLGPDGERVDRGEPTFAGAVVRIPVDPGGPRGTYLVSYRVISADSHPVAGAYTYSVGAPSTPPSEPAAATADPVVSGAVKVVKYLGYLGLALLIGAALVLALLWPARLPRRDPARLAWTGYGLVTAVTLAGLWLQVPYVAGGGLFAVSPAGLLDVLGTTYGTAHLVRLGILIAVALLLRPLLAGRAGRADLVLLGVLGAAGLVSWSITGHPAASPVPAVSIVADAVHLGSMAFWLGGLVMLFAFLLPRADEQELGAILPVWSRWAASAVAALVLAGVAQALIEVGSPTALVNTAYGRLLIAKVVFFIALLGLANHARRLVLRREAAGQPGRLRRTVLVEIAVAAVVLALSAVLVQTTPARTAEANEQGANAGYFSATLDSDLYRLQVIVDPARVGENSVHLDAYTLENRPLPVVEWRATVALPAQGIEPISVPLLPLTDTHATGEISLPAPGDWVLRVTVRISDIDQATVTATVPVS